MMAYITIFGFLAFGIYVLLWLPTILFNMLFNRLKPRGPVPGTDQPYPEWVRNRHRKIYDLLVYNYRIPADQIKQEDCV